MQLALPDAARAASTRLPCQVKAKAAGAEGNDVEVRLPPVLAYWDATNRPIPKVPPVAAMLKAAIEMLENGAIDEGCRALDAAMVALPTLG